MEIRRVEPVYKSCFDLKKEKEKQNEEKRQLLLLKKKILEEKMKNEKVGTKFDKRI